MLLQERRKFGMREDGCQGQGSTSMMDPEAGQVGPGGVGT